MGERLKQKISVCLPVYNGALTIAETIQTILDQSYSDFEFIIVDNASKDNTVAVVNSIKDARIKLFINEVNLGCGGNLNEACKKAAGDILFFISADDLFDIDSLKKILDAFELSEEIGIVSRSYYWFEEKYDKPVRAKRQFKEIKQITIDSPFEDVRDLLETSDQISGIAFKRKYIKTEFLNKPFVEMASMVANTIKNCKAVILKDNIVAVRIFNNGASESWVFNNSPMAAWYDVIVNAYSEEKCLKLKKYLIREFVASNYVGLVQIRVYGKYKALLREIKLLVKYRVDNLLYPGFWAFSLGTLLTPKKLLRKISVSYKNRVNSKLLQNVKIINLKEARS